MCGISGFIDFSHSSTESILQSMTNALQHRGPDGEGIHFEHVQKYQLGLGHRRLSIIDLKDTGKQPMHYKHLSITFNGEIYNFKEIKHDLEQLGHIFFSHSDTEVILQAFEVWGIECIQKFIGMFAFVIYDVEKQMIYCVRDRAGVKPLFYYWENNVFLFASELKAFHQHPKFKKRINKDAIVAYMQYGHVPTPHSIFEQAFKLNPGHYLKFDLNNKVFSTHQYWNVYDTYNKPKLDISFQEAKIATEGILKSAFDYRMVADVPVGVFLSGGYDSTCVAAMLQKDSGEKIKTFTISVPEIGLDEAPFAKEISKFIGTEHYEFSCTQKEALELIPDLPYFYDEPFGDSSAIPTTLVSKIAKQLVTVALSADGGDEVFAGYNRYDYLLKYGNAIRSIPGPLAKGMANLMDIIPANTIPILKDKYNFHNRYHKLKGWLREPSSKNIMLSLSRQFENKELQRLFIHRIKEINTAYVSEELEPLYQTPLSYIMAIDYQTYLQDDILQKVDRASMSVGLEGREPFLDHRIIEWAAQLPDDFKYFKGTKKHILKEIVYQYIPKNKMDRPKSGFSIPIEKWLSNELKSLVQEYLEDALLVKQQIFVPEEIQKIKSDFFNGKKENGLKIWYLLMFQMWYEKWMGEPI
jgi:asparagine synthase (glutamine-hydrolysing)